MVIIVKERGFYYLRHNIQKKEKRKYLGKIIPKNVEQLKKEFLREFYCKEWSTPIQKIIREYKKEIRGTTRSIKLKRLEGFAMSFTYNTQRIEGSSLTLADTWDLIIHGITPARKMQVDTIETQKHYDLFIGLVTSKKLLKITKKTILEWHKKVFDQTKIGEAGDIRYKRVGIATNDKIEFAAVPDIPAKLEEFFSWLDRYDAKKYSPVEFAALAHYKFVSIHPFADGNGRISRLIMNYILFKYDYPFMLIKNSDKKAYFRALERSHLCHDEIFFLKWFMRYYIKANKQYL